MTTPPITDTPPHAPATREGEVEAVLGEAVNHRRGHPEPLPEGIRHGEPGYRRAVIALVAAGLASFNALYCTQALLPALTEQMHINQAQASLTVSAATGVLALAIIPASILSERYGRGRVLVASAVIATLLGLLLPLAPTIQVLVLGRALQGLALAGVPAVAMTWLAEEMHGDHLATAMGRYVAGTTVGGLLGRLIPAGVLEFGSWRWALAATTIFAACWALVLARLLPPQRRFRPKQIRLRAELSALAGHWRDPKRAGLFLLAFLLMGTFVSLYNFLGFRLMGAPFHFGEAQVGGVFILYLAGTWSSVRAGALADRIGRAPVVVVGVALCIVGLLLTLVDVLPLLIGGVVLLTVGFFAAHSVASAWVGALATTHRAEASSTYLFCYYLGSSIVGYLSGLVLHHAGWGALVAWLTGVLAVALLVAAVVTRQALAARRARLARTA